MTAKLTYASSNSSMIHQVYTKVSTTELVFGHLILIKKTEVYNFKVLDEKPICQDTEIYHASKHPEVR